MSVIKSMQPTAIETWRESNWFERGVLIGFEALIVAAMALRTDWVDAILATWLACWQWGYMRNSVELNRWHAACLNDPSKFRTHSTIEETDNGIVYRPATAVTINVADANEAFRKAQENAQKYEKLRGIRFDGR
ncbi:hypothetical protein [Nocardia sp. NPDC049707]|uniref:hypothetical protein n=1 Tax=Nocardia sp. NPDC049707 TaxID=3154735 RepID=UPI00343D5D61